MRDDVAMFGTIWAVLLIAFATAMHSAAHTHSDFGGQINAPCDDTHDQVLPMQLWE